MNDVRNRVAPSGLRRLAWAALLTALAPSLLAGQTAPAPTTLSLEEAVARARQQNPSFLSEQNEMNVARWQMRQARADFLPNANASTSFGWEQAGEQRFGAVGFGERPAYYSSSYNLGLQLEMSGSKLLQPTVARANARATEQRVHGAEAALVSNVVHQYLTVLQAAEGAAQAEREVARTGEHVRLAQARLEVGAGTQLDVRRAEVQQGQAEIRLVQAENAQATAALALGQLMGESLDPDVQLSSQFVVFDPTWESADLMQRALRNNPNLLAARASADAAGTSMRQAQSAYLPRLTFSTALRGTVYRAGDLDPLVDQQINNRSFQSCQEQNAIRQAAGLGTVECLNPANPAHREFVREELESQNPSWPFGYTRQPVTAAVTLSLPLFTGLQRELQIAQARVNAQDARYQVRAQELQLQTDVATGVRNLQTAYRTVQIQERVRATASEELRLAQERFRFGAASSVEVTDAQTNLGEAERALIDAVYDFHKSLAALESFIGEPLR